METKSFNDRVLVLVAFAIVAGIVSYLLYFLKTPDVVDQPLSVVHNKVPSNTPAALPQTVRFVNEQYGFTFSYPAGWDFTELQNGTVDIKNHNYQCPVNADCLPMVISVSALPIPADMPISAYISSKRDQDLYNYKQQNFDMQAASAMKVSFGDGGTKTHEYYIKPNGKDYIIIVWEVGYPAEGEALARSLTY